MHAMLTTPTASSAVQIGELHETPRLTYWLNMAVDNEFSQTATHAAYFTQLEDQYRKGGVVVPLSVAISQ